MAWDSPQRSLRPGHLSPAREACAWRQDRGQARGHRVAAGSLPSCAQPRRPRRAGPGPRAAPSRRRAHAGRRALENRQTTREPGASGPEQADAESRAQWGGGDRTTHAGLPAQGPPALSPGRAPGSGLGGLGPGPAGVPEQEGLAGVRGLAEGAGAGELVLPGHPGTDQGHGSPRPAGRGPTGQASTFIGAGCPRGAGHPPPAALLSGEEAEAWLLEPATSPEKGKTQGLASASWLRATLPASAPNIFPKRDAFARLVAGGEGRLWRDWLGSGADL